MGPGDDPPKVVVVAVGFRDRKASMRKISPLACPAVKRELGYDREEGHEPTQNCGSRAPGANRWSGTKPPWP